jgi:hypothetical protein
VPFYYIEYGIAQLGAYQLWIRSLDEGADVALDAYKKALWLGGSRPLPELFAAAGLEFDFGPSIQQTPDGGYIVAGESTSFAPGFDIVLLRLDALGTYVWARSYRGTFMGDPIHTPHPGVALDQGPDDDVYVVGNFEGRPVAFRAGPGGFLDWYAEYSVPLPTGIDGKAAFTDVEFSAIDRTAVISGTIVRDEPFDPADPTGGFVTRQDATLLKVVGPSTAGGPLGGSPIWYFGYDSVFDRDDPDVPLVFETGDGVDVLPEGEIILAGRTDYGLPAGARGGTHLVFTDPTGFPIWSADYENFSLDGTDLRVETAYAAIEYDLEKDVFVQAGRVRGSLGTRAHTQLTAPGGAPIWAWAYGGGDQRTFGESVQPARGTCGYGYVGHISNPAPFPGQDGNDVYLVKNNDAGETGCLERQVVPEPVAPLEIRQLGIRPEYFQETITLPDLVNFVDGPNEAFCEDDDCVPGVGPCNPADLAPPFGALTFGDISAFIAAYIAMDPAADLAPPFGAWTFGDISAFIAFYTAGCP